MEVCGCGLWAVGCGLVARGRGHARWLHHYTMEEDMKEDESKKIICLCNPT